MKEKGGVGEWGGGTGKREKRGNCSQDVKEKKEEKEEGMEREGGRKGKRKKERREEGRKDGRREETNPGFLVLQT